VASAKAAGLYVVGIAGTASADRLELADEVVPRLDAELVDRLLSL
jgi:beta-phosphoglucomutase-like phosphatase (HAD superfamily)